MSASLSDEQNHFPGLSRIGALLADPGRAAMLWALMDGSARPAGELTHGGRPLAVCRQRPSGAPHRRRPAGSRGARPASLLPDCVAGYRGVHRSTRQRGASERAATRSAAPRAHGARRHALRAHLLRPHGRRTVGAALRADAEPQAAEPARQHARSHRRTASPSSPDGASTRPASAAAGAASPAPVPTGASGVRTWAARSARRCSTPGRPMAGWSAPNGRASCGSHRPVTSISTIF